MFSPMTDQPLPTDLKKTEDRCLLISWSDGVNQKIPFRRLREGCQCATCNEKRMKGPEPKPASNVLPILTAAEARPLDIVKMHPVGNYAYNIEFSDGHSSGIFTFELLRLLGS